MNQLTPSAITGVVVTSVSFGGVAGESVVHDGSMWTVTTPTHDAGVVDVVLEWTLGGVTQPAITYEAGFEFLSLAVSTPTEVPDGEPEGELAATGAVPMSLLGVAVGVLLLGALLLVMRRDRARAGQ